MQTRRRRRGRRKRREDILSEGSERAEERVGDPMQALGNVDGLCADSVDAQSARSSHVLLLSLWSGYTGLGNFVWARDGVTTFP